MATKSLAPANECQCDVCRSACTVKPGWFLPEQIAPLAAALELTEQELFDQHLAVDWYQGTEASNWETIFVLSPAVITGQPGDMYPRNPQGQCRWYIKGNCAIHSIGKPFECAAYVHTEESIGDRHKETAEAWIPYQQYIRDLLGREPIEQSWTIFDRMEFYGGG